MRNVHVNNSRIIYKESVCMQVLEVQVTSNILLVRGEAGIGARV